MKKLIFTLLLSWVFVCPHEAQNLNYSLRKDYLDSQLKNLPAVEDSMYSDSKEYVNGRLYLVKGNSYVHPFFIDNSWKNGTIWYTGNSFDLEMLKYDLNKDVLVHLFYDKGTMNPIYFEKEHVGEFTIDGRHFTYLKDFINTGQKRLKPGYYEVIFDGVEKFYVRREKLKNVEKDPLDQNYSTWTYMYLKKDGEYFRINGNQGLISALGDHKKEVRAFIRQNRIRIKSDDYQSVKSVLGYYNKIKRNG